MTWSEFWDTAAAGFLLGSAIVAAAVCCAAVIAVVTVVVRLCLRVRDRVWVVDDVEGDDLNDDPPPVTYGGADEETPQYVSGPPPVTMSAARIVPTDVPDDPLFVGFPRAEMTHKCPREGQFVTPCCGRPPSELPWSDRMTLDPSLVTCGEHSEYEGWIKNIEDAPDPGYVLVTVEGPNRPRRVIQVPKDRTR